MCSYRHRNCKTNEVVALYSMVSALIGFITAFGLATTIL